MSDRDLVSGKCFWCLAPSTESESYGDASVQKPWYGRVVECLTIKRLRLCRVSEHFASGIDDDSNASCFIQDGTPLFKTLEEANREYVGMVCAEVMREIHDTRYKLRELKKLAKKMNIDHDFSVVDKYSKDAG